MTAHYLVDSIVPLEEGVVVVQAAAGGVGLLLTQMATARGLRVIGTTSTEAKAELVRRAGEGEGRSRRGREGSQRRRRRAGRVRLDRPGDVRG